MREYHSEQQWKVWIDELNASGFSLKAWAAAHAFRPQTVSRWRSRINKRYNNSASAESTWIKLNAPLTPPLVKSGQIKDSVCPQTNKQSSAFYLTVNKVKITIPLSYSDGELSRLIKIARAS